MMKSFVIDYDLRDGAPLAVFPNADGTGQWTIHCRCCRRTFTEDSRDHAFDLAHVHTYIGEEFDCQAGKATQLRRERRQEGPAMTATERIGVINYARRRNILQKHTVSSPAEHAKDLVAILLGAVAKGER